MVINSQYPALGATLRESSRMYCTKIYNCCVNTFECVHLCMVSLLTISAVNSYLVNVLCSGQFYCGMYRLALGHNLKIK